MLLFWLGGTVRTVEDNAENLSPACPMPYFPFPVIRRSDTRRAEQLSLSIYINQNRNQSLTAFRMEAFLEIYRVFLLYEELFAHLCHSGRLSDIEQHD